MCAFRRRLQADEASRRARDSNPWERRTRAFSLGSGRVDADTGLQRLVFWVQIPPGPLFSTLSAEVFLVVREGLLACVPSAVDLHGFENALAGPER